MPASFPFPFRSENLPRGRGALFWAAFAFTLVLALYSRFHALSAESMWLDETTTWERAGLPIAELIEDSRRRLHNPLYFLIIHAVMQVSDSEVALRMPSAALGGLTLLATAVLGHICAGPRAAMAALLLLSISPLRLRYDQEARMYALYGFAVAVLLCGLMWLLRNPQKAALPLFGSQAGAASKPRWAYAALIFGSTLSLYSHNTALLALLCVGLSLALCLSSVPRALRRGLLLNFALSMVAVFILYLPWLSSLLWQTQRLHAHFWAEFPDGRELRNVTLALYLFGGFRASLMVLSLLLLCAAIVLYRRQPRVLVPLLVCAFLTPLLVLLISLRRPIFIDRVMLWVVIPYVVLLSLPLARARTPVFVLVLAVCGLCGVDQLAEHYYGAQKKPDFRRLVAEIAQVEDSVALLAGGREAQQFRYYTQRRHRPIEGVTFHDVATEDKQALPITPLLAGKRTVFVVRRRAWPTLPYVLSEVRKQARQVGSKYYGYQLLSLRFETLEGG